MAQVKPIGAIDAHNKRAAEFARTRAKAPSGPVETVKAVAKDVGAGISEIVSQGKAAASNIRAGYEKIRAATRR